MSNTPSPYPSLVATYTVKVNHIDVYNDDHINKLQNDVIALQTYVGTNPHGSRSTFADRMNVCIGSYGGIQGSGGFPADTTPRRLFYRDDSETLFIRRFDNTSWQAIGNSPSNVLFSWVGCESASNDVNVGQGIYTGTAIRPVTTSGMANGFIAVGQSSATYNVFNFKFNKTSGITGVKFMNRSWCSGGTAAVVCVVAVGPSAVGTGGAVSNTTPTWAGVSSLIDVSGLTNGSYYDVSISISHASSEYAYLSSFVMWGQ